jgi:hypothetical protein
MTMKRAWGLSPGSRILTRRDALAVGTLAAASLGLPGGFIQRAQAQTVSFDYYIGPDGNDNNPGTQSQPWAITAINAKRSTYAGKRVGLLDGVYGLISAMGQPFTGSGQSQTARLRIAGGTASSPTVIMAVNARQAVIDWQRSLQTNGSMQSSLEPGGPYVTIDGIVFDNNNYQCIVNNPGGGSGYDYLTVKNCLFRNQSYTGGGGNNSAMVYSQGADHILISNCRFDGGSAPFDSNRHNAIMFYTPTVDAIIEYCTFVSEPLGCDVIHFKQSGVTNGTIRNCYINRSAVTQSSQSGYCIKWEGVSDSSDIANIYNNVIVSGGSTSRSILSAEPNTAGTWNIYNNTLVGPWANSGGIVGIHDRAPLQSNFFRNILYRSSGSGGTYGDVNFYSIGTLGTVDNNYYPSSPKIVLGNGAATYSSLASWQTASGKDANSTAGVSPLFVGSGSDAAYYQLQTISSCKTLGPGGTEIGAWRGAVQVGCSFGGGVVLKAPASPQLTGIT